MNAECCYTVWSVWLAACIYVCMWCIHTYVCMRAYWEHILSYAMVGTWGSGAVVASPPSGCRIWDPLTKPHWPCWREPVAPHLWTWAKIAVSRLCGRQTPKKKPMSLAHSEKWAQRKYSLCRSIWPNPSSVSLRTDLCSQNACEQNRYLWWVFSFMFLKYKNYKLYQ